MQVTKKQVSKICEKIKDDLLEFNFLARGNHNDCFLVKTKTKKLVLKIENNNQFKNLKTEYKFLKKLNGKFGPKVFLFDNTHKIIPKDYLLQEFVEGSFPWKKTNEKFIELMANWYKKLHKHKKKISCTERKNKHLIKQLRNYDKKIQKYKSVVPKKVRDDYDSLFSHIKCFFNKYNNILNLRKYFSLVQGDPSKSNVFFNRNTPKLIDWEFARYDHPETDLVFFCYAYNLNKYQWNLFLNIYGYKNTRISKILLDLFFIRHYIAIASWRFERLYFLSIKKADLKQKASNKEKMLDEINNDLAQIKRILI